MGRKNRTYNSCAYCKWNLAGECAKRDYNICMAKPNGFKQYDKSKH